MWINTCRMPKDHLNRWFFLICLLDDTRIVLITVLRDDLIFLRDQGGKIHRKGCRCQSWIAWMGRIKDEPGCLNQVLGGQAATIDAGAAQSTSLSHDRRFAEVFGADRS